MRRPASDPALEEFREAMGRWSHGRTDAELAAWKATLDWIALVAVSGSTATARQGVASEAS